jgi:hypothetical protein
VGKQNSGFTDEEISDIICLLIPHSENARREVALIAARNPQLLVGTDAAEAVEGDEAEDDAGSFALASRATGEHCIALRLSSPVKDPAAGFAFGRNPNRCDVAFKNDEFRRLSNIHFRIFLNTYGVIMIEDQSTNGTFVDEILLKGRAKDNGPPKRPTQRTLTSGARIKILMHQNQLDLDFLVRIPRREGKYEMAYRRNMTAYLDKLNKYRLERAKVVTAGPGGHVRKTLFRYPQECLLTLITGRSVS